MELTGRLTGDALISTLKDQRQVINFTIAINDSYKPKGSDAVKKLTTFVNCSFWRTPGIAAYLKKGTLVELFGRISVNAWINTSGEAKASLNFHVSNIKLHGNQNSAMEENNAPVAPASEVADDLPF
jgi:single-strand DNA-binding protein